MSTINQRVTQAGIMINAALENHEIAVALHTTGYTKERITDMAKQIDIVTKLSAEQDKEQGDQISATAELNKQRKNADSSYMRILKFARIGLAEHEKAPATLSLFARRKVAFSEWYGQADSFYQNILAETEYLNALNSFGVTKEAILEGYNLLQATKPLASKQTNETAESVAATAKRDRELEILDKEFSNLKKVCKIIFEDKKELKMKLGI